MNPSAQRATETRCGRDGGRVAAGDPCDRLMLGTEEPSLSTCGARATPNRRDGFTHPLGRLVQGLGQFFVLASFRDGDPVNWAVARRAGAPEHAFKHSDHPLIVRKVTAVLSPKDELVAEGGNVTAVTFEQFEHAPPVLGAESP